MNYTCGEKKINSHKASGFYVLEANAYSGI